MQRGRIFEAIMALALLSSGASGEGMNTVTGAATYRERMALSPGAVFEATLEDVSRADAPAVVVGQTRPARQAPGHFRWGATLQCL